MLTLKKIAITHFKNYTFNGFNFDENVVGICGLNGKGKTNLLDAIYYCCFTKSYFTSTDALNINFDKDGFRIEAHFYNNEIPQKIICINRGNSKKEFSVNDIPYEKLSQHVGTLPAVIIAPDDVDIIIAGSEGRRRYLDTIICQLDADYLQQLMQYNKVMQQRNSLLKRFAEQGMVDATLLDIINQQLITPAEIVFNKRTLYTQQLIPLITSFYKNIADNDEAISFEYISPLQQNTLANWLQINKTKDAVLQRTNAGIHKDDIHFTLNAQPFKTIASQGQRKSLLFALKLAQYQLLKNDKGYSPLLLLDDVFEKLDEKRMYRLLHWVCKENNGQVFITDTHQQRLEAIFDALDIKGQIIAL